MYARSVLAAALVATLTFGCAGSPDDDVDASPSTVEAVDGVIRAVDVGGSETDVFLPPDADGSAPVVVMLHGTGGDRTRMHGLASAVAEDGALVYVPSWPVIDTVQPYPVAEGDEPYRRQSEAVICTLRRIRAEAAELGGDPDDLTVVGHSGGAMLGARVAMVDEPPWPGIDCDPDVEHAPTRFIGLGGDYIGAYQNGEQMAEQYAPYDLLAIEPTNAELEAWLLHGNNDTTINSVVSHELVDHLAEYGIEGVVLTTDWAHAEPLDPEEPAGEFAAEQITSIVRGEPGAAWTRTDADATLSFDDAERCEYTGPSTLARGDDLVIDLENRSGVDIFFVLVSVRVDAEADDAELLEGDGVLGVDDPDWVDWGGFRPVEPGGSVPLRFAMVEADQRFVLYCHVSPEADHPRPNWMYPTAVLTPTDAPS